MKLAIVLLVALPLPAYADGFGTQGTFLPKGGVSVSHQRFPNVNGGIASFTSIGIAPELGYFVIDNLALFASIQAHFLMANGSASVGGGGGLGIGYHFDLGSSLGLLPAIDALVRASRNGASTHVGMIARARLPLVFTRNNLYFGVGPEAHWYGDLSGDPNISGSVLVGLFTEIGGWL